MICTECGMEEEVLYWILDELSDGIRGDGFEICCPSCDGKMIENSNYINKQ